MSSAPLPRCIAWFAPWTWKRRWVAARIAGLLAIVGYPLSFGPAYALLMQGWISRLLFETFYAPLIWAAAVWQPLGYFLYWYTSLFGP